MMLKKNNDFIKIGGSKTVTVTMTFDIDEGCSDAVILRNAAEAAKWLANTGTLHTWVRKVEVNDSKRTLSSGAAGLPGRTREQSRSR